MDRARLTYLTSQYIAGALSADENDELYRFLLSSSTAREQFDRIIVGHRVNNPEVVIHTATEFLEYYVPGAKVVPLLPEPDADKTDTATLFRTAVRSWRMWSVGGALAACVVAALFIALHSTRPPQAFSPPKLLSSAPAATLLHAANVQWLNLTNEVFPGHTFGAAELVATTGVFQLQFKRGARLVVKAPARLQLVSDNEAYLYHGNVTAFVPDEAHGFKITSPMSVVTDLGTEFGVVADGTRSDVHVFDGIVEMERPAAQPKRMVEGEAVRVEGRRVKPAIVNRNVFMFEDEVKALEREEQRRRFAEWKSAAWTLGRDPAALIHYTFEDQDEFGSQLSNCVARPLKGSTATIKGTWGSGRWPDKRGLTFGAKDDRIRFKVSGALTSLTYMAWLRVDKLNNLSNALAITESGSLGEVHWQIYRDGRVALSSHSGKKGSVDETWDRGLSPALFTGSRLGTWTHLTSVFDSANGTIKHFLNGEFVSATPIKRPVPLILENVEIGNWGFRDVNRRYNPEYVGRNWTGCIDEFALLGRALSADEVRDYYLRGRVSVGTLFLATQKDREPGQD